MRRSANGLYVKLVKQSRRPGFYSKLGVPDSLDGRFEMVVLHLFIVTHVLRNDTGGKFFRRVLLEAMIDDMDRSLREIGVSDLAVGKKIKHMATAFMGRVDAYRLGIEEGSDVLLAALARNVYGTVDSPNLKQIGRLESYVRENILRLKLHRKKRLLNGEVDFDPDV